MNQLPRPTFDLAILVLVLVVLSMAEASSIWYLISLAAFFILSEVVFRKPVDPPALEENLEQSIKERRKEILKQNLKQKIPAKGGCAVVLVAIGGCILLLTAFDTSQELIPDKIRLSAQILVGIMALGVIIFCLWLNRALEEEKQPSPPTDDA